MAQSSTLGLPGDQKITFTAILYNFKTLTPVHGWSQQPASFMEEYQRWSLTNKPQTLCTIFQQTIVTAVRTFLFVLMIVCFFGQGLMGCSLCSPARSDTKPWGTVPAHCCLSRHSFCIIKWLWQVHTHMGFSTVTKITKIKTTKQKKKQKYMMMDLDSYKWISFLLNKKTWKNPRWKCIM